MEPEPLLYREEALAVLGALADSLVELGEIQRLLGGDGGEAEEDLEE